MLKSFIFVGSSQVGAVFSEKLLQADFELATGVENADAILVYCESQTELEDVFFDSKGLVQTASKESYLINLSASTPSFARELNAVAIVSDLHAIEAPLMVLDPTLEHAFSSSENLSCFLAGEDQDIEVAMPLLAHLADCVKVTGISGSAQLAHASLIVQRSAQFVACMETEALFRAFSSSSDVAIDFAHTQGLLSDLNFRLLDAVKKERFKSDYSVKLWMAELTAALMAADDIDLILPGAEACLHLLELLATIGGSSMSPAALSLVYDEEALCAKHGLDWTRAEQTYADEREEELDDCGHDHDHDDFSGGFGSYSSN